MKKWSPLSTLILSLLLMCCCLTWLVAAGMFALFVAGAPSEALSEPATMTPVLTRPSTPASQFARTATARVRKNPYEIAIATPTSPALKYPVSYATDFQVMTYRVTGKTSSEIARSLNANALTDTHEPNSRYYARTDWHLRGDWTYAPTSRGCEVTGGRVSITITMTLPALATTDVPADLQNRWNEFLNNTVTHESGHVKIGYDSAREYQRQLGNFGATANCSVLQAQLQNLFRQNYERVDRANVEYDAATQHGITQGAVFP